MLLESRLELQCIRWPCPCASLACGIHARVTFLTYMSIHQNGICEACLCHLHVYARVIDVTANTNPLILYAYNQAQLNTVLSFDTHCYFF